MSSVFDRRFVALIDFCVFLWRLDKYVMILFISAECDFLTLFTALGGICGICNVGIKEIIDILNLQTDCKMPNLMIITNSKVCSAALQICIKWCNKLSEIMNSTFIVVRRFLDKSNNHICNRLPVIRN